MTGETFPLAAQGGEHLARRRVQRLALRLPAAGGVDGLEGGREARLEALALGASLREALLLGASLRGGERAVRDVQRPDARQPRGGPGGELRVGVAGADEVAPDMAQHQSGSTPSTLASAW